MFHLLLLLFLYLYLSVSQADVVHYLCGDGKRQDHEAEYLSGKGDDSKCKGKQ